MNRAGRLPSWVAHVLGVIGLVLAWALFAELAFRPDPGMTYDPVPSPLAVGRQILDDGFSAYWDFFSVTIHEAAVGFLWGNGLALLLAASVLLVPRLEPVVVQVAVVSYCLPIVAVGGIAIVALGGADTPGDPSRTAIFLAALSVFFTTVVGALLGFKAADRASLDVVHVYGGGRVRQLFSVRLVAALPSILNALQVAVPTALLGAVLGEYMGATDRSVGITLIRLQGQLDSVRVWAVFLLCALAALVGYTVFGLLARMATPWVSGRSTS